jgi:matrixin
MPHRRLFPAPGHAFALVAAMLAAFAASDCAGFQSARDGILSGTLSSPEARTPSRAGATVGEIMSDARGTYIDRLLADRDSTIERWPNHVAQPLRVWIDSSSTVGGAQASFPAAVRAAFGQWVSTGIPLRFTFVSSSRSADVKVHWTSYLSHKTGSTTWRTDDNGWLLSGDITLATHISDGHPLDSRGMRAIALHEVGHALGLSHSTDAADIMAPLVRVDGLSPADRNTIRLLYSLPAGRVR